jgi:hypothetical protein|tara:strand:+ start:79 stop:579 length:501 start_codon:yes stop_codon:yes gene_type:complete
MKSSGLTKIKSAILALVIAIVLASLVGYAINVFEEGPEWDDYCGDFRNSELDNEVTQESCEAQEGARWRDNYCDYNYQCQMDYDDARDKHGLTVFLVSVPAGLIALFVGVVLGLPSVSSGLMLGGVFLVFYGTASYWSNFSDIVRVIILAIALSILIWLGYKKLEH